jgi:hypothetical protein
MGVPQKRRRNLRQRGFWGRAAIGCAALRHFVLAARAATLCIPHAFMLTFLRVGGTTTKQSLF